MSKTITRLLVSIVAVSAFCTSMSRVAHAGNVYICPVDYVGVDSRLAIHCANSNVTYYAYIANVDSNCPVDAIDKIKMWESMAMTAMLAGKNVKLWAESTSACPLRFTWLQVDR